MRGMVKVLLCHNPNAGNKGHDRESLEAALKLAGHDVRYASVKDDKFIAAFDKSVDLIVAAGGDGTIGQVLTSIPDRSVPVALLPLGTANNFARSLGIAGTPQELVEMWDADHTCPVSLGSVTGHWGTTLFLEAYGIGVFPQFLLDAKKGKKPEGADNLRHGRELFQKAIKRSKPIEITLTIDGKRHEHEVLGIEICNIAFTGPGLPLAAKADVSDDKLDVVLLEKDSRKDLMAWVEAPQDDEPPVTYRKGSQIEVNFRDAPTRLDDESFDATGGKHSIDIVCEEVPLRVVIPVKHPAQKTPEKKVTAA